MSRRCPKRNHLFLNWLRANRSRFQFEPQIKKMKRYIDGGFAGITPALGFIVNKGGLMVTADWNGRCWDAIADFDVAERHSEQGIFCCLCTPDERDFYPTRAALWTEHGFEPFLAWCNEKLTVNRYLAIYEFNDGGGTEAKLQKEDALKESVALKQLLRGLKPLGTPENSPELVKDVTQNIVQMIPLFKSSRSRNGAENEAGV